MSTGGYDMARQVAADAARISSDNLAAIAEIQNERFKRLDERAKLEQRAIDADRRFRVSSSNAESLKASREFGNKLREETTKSATDLASRKFIDDGLKSQQEALDAEIKAISLEVTASEIGGNPSEAVKARLADAKAKRDAIIQQRTQVQSGTYQPQIPSAPTTGGPSVPYPTAPAYNIGAPSFNAPSNAPVTFKVDNRTRDEIEGISSKPGARYISLDYNSKEPGSTANHALVIIPDDASEEERMKAWDYVNQTTAWFRSNGVEVDEPTVRTTSGNEGQGKAGYFHTEPAFVQNEAAMGMLRDRGAEYAQILANTLGTIPGSTFIPPHTTYAMGAGSSNVEQETIFATKYIIPYLQNIAEGKSGQQPTGQQAAGQQATGQQGPVAGKVTAYAPTYGASNVPGAGGQGGYESSKPGPDGVAEVRTMDDYVNGRSQYVTIAGNEAYMGNRYVIPELTYIDAEGQERQLKNVPAVVHDTGSAFKDAPEGRFDIPVARDVSAEVRNANHENWRSKPPVFIPDGMMNDGVSKTEEYYGPQPRNNEPSKGNVEFVPEEAEQELAEPVQFFGPYGTEPIKEGSPKQTQAKSASSEWSLDMVGPPTPKQFQEAQARALAGGEPTEVPNLTGVNIDDMVGFNDMVGAPTDTTDSSVPNFMGADLSGPIKFQAKKSEDTVTFGEQQGGGIKLSMSQAELAKKLKISPTQIRDYINRIDTEFADDDDASKMLIGVLSDRVLREAPDAFDDEFGVAASETLSGGGTRYDFEKAIPEYAKRVGLETRAIQRFNNLKMEKESDKIFKDTVKELDSEIDESRRRIQGFQEESIKAKALDSPAAKELYDFYEQSAKSEIARLQSLSQQREGVYAQRSIAKGEGYGAALNDAQSLLSKMKAGDLSAIGEQPEKPEGTKFPKAGEIINGTQKEVAGPPTPENMPRSAKYEDLRRGIAKLGVKPEFLESLPNLDVSKSPGFFEMDEQKNPFIKAAVKAFYDSSLQDFNKFGEQQKQEFLETAKTQISNADLEAMLRDSYTIGLPRLTPFPKTNLAPNNDKEDAARRNLIRSDPSIMYTLLRMRRSDFVNKTRTLINAQRTQNDQEEEQKKLDKFNLMMKGSIPND